MDETMHCIRGLEDKLSKDMYREKASNRAAIVRLVVRIHQEQRKQNMLNENI